MTTTMQDGAGFMSRKFLLAAFAMLSASILVFAGHISDGVYSAVMLGTIAAYITGNVSQRNTEKKAEADVAKAKVEVAKIEAQRVTAGGAVLE